MLEIPEKTSTQNIICFMLDETISEGTSIALLDEDGNVIVSFKANSRWEDNICTPKRVNLL